MRIVCISDTHGLHPTFGNLYPLPKGDVLIHSGDVSNRGTQNEVEEFIYWFQSLKNFETKIFIAGNHDFAFEELQRPAHKKDFEWLRTLLTPENLSQSNVTYLEDDELLITSPEFSRPIKFYGSPWQPEFYNWAFNLPRNGWELEDKWMKIPDDTDILITHGPPHGILDYVRGKNGYQYAGCEKLLHRVNQINPMVHVFGHIHEGYGTNYKNQTLFVNASTCDSGYVPLNKPIVFDLKEIDGVITIIQVFE